MKIKELTEQQIDYIKSVYVDENKSWDDKIFELVDYLGKSERTVRKWLVALGFKNKTTEESVQYKEAKNRKFDKTKKRFIITWAQNNTPVNKGFLSNIESYAKHIDADIHIIAGRYKNPTSVFTDIDQEFWAEEIQEYLDANRHNIHKYFSILSDIKIQPTAVNPLTGLESISKENSCVVGHPRVHMQVMPALEGYKPKIMMSTGAITKNNYTDSKSGKKSDFHHTFGFVIVEIKDSKIFFSRQVTASSKGDFTDLYFNVKDGKVTKINTISALVAGDIHVGDHDEKIIDATFNVLCKKLKPKNIILHDIFNGHSISHHELKDPFIQAKREKDGTNSLGLEISAMLKWLERVKDYNVTVVKSNHDDFLDRWLKSTDWRRMSTFKNSLEYMEYSSAILSGKAPNGVIPYVINSKFPKMKCLGINDSFIVNNWELGQHGHIGKNGSRGSLEQFRTLNKKICVGHYHTPGRKDGALSVGTSTKLRVGYNFGASSWLHSHIIIHEDGKSQHINFINNEYTTLT